MSPSRCRNPSRLKGCLFFPFFLLELETQEKDFDVPIAFPFPFRFADSCWVVAIPKKF